MLWLYKAAAHDAQGKESEELKNNTEREVPGPCSH